MKKLLLLSAFILSTLFTNAQTTLSNAKSFLSDLQYTATVGILSRSSNEPFNKAKVGFNIGVDAKKNIKSYMDDKLGIYGMTGLHLVQKGGKQSNNFMEMLEVGNSFSVTQFSIPIHAGGEYNWKKCSLFLDLGPYLAFGLGGSKFEGFDRKPIDFGLGFNVGVKFNRFAISAGLDKGFTKIGEYEITEENYIEGYKVGDKLSMKGYAVYFNLHWTFKK